MNNTEMSSREVIQTHLSYCVCTNTSEHLIQTPLVILSITGVCLPHPLITVEEFCLFILFYSIKIIVQISLSAL